MKTRSRKAYTPTPESYGRYGRAASSKKRKSTDSLKVETRASKKESSDMDQLRQPTPPSTPEQDTPRANTRSQHPSCSNFGPYRHQIYPGYFFCEECKWWDDIQASGGNNRAKRDSAKFRCTAGHTSFVFPNVKKRPVACMRNYCARIPKQDSIKITQRVSDLNCNLASQSSSNNSSQPPPREEAGLLSKTGPAAPALNQSTDSQSIKPPLREPARVPTVAVQPTVPDEELISQIEALRSKVSEMEQMLTRAHSQNWRMRMNFAEDEDNPISDHLGEEGMAQAARDEERRHIRQDVFPAWKVLRAMDKKGGTLGYEGLEICSRLKLRARSTIAVASCLVYLMSNVPRRL